MPYLAYDGRVDPFFIQDVLARGWILLATALLLIIIKGRINSSAGYRLSMAANDFHTRPILNPAWHI
jgi:hypothetical protein